MGIYFFLATLDVKGSHHHHQVTTVLDVSVSKSRSRLVLRDRRQRLTREEHLIFSVNLIERLPLPSINLRLTPIDLSCQHVCLPEKLVDNQSPLAIKA